MIKASNTKETLRMMLKNAEFDFTKPDCKVALENFKKFFDINVKCDEDALLFKCGVSDLKGKKVFSLEYVRQFSFLVQGEDEHREQLRLIIYFKPNEEFEIMKISLWSYECNSAKDFFDKVEASKEFQIASDKYVALQARIVYEGV